MGFFLAWLRFDDLSSLMIASDEKDRGLMLSLNPPSPSLSFSDWGLDWEGKTGGVGGKRNENRERES